MAAAPISWQWQDAASGQWVAYPDDVQVLLREAAANANKSIQVQLNGVPYYISLTDLFHHPVAAPDQRAAVRQIEIAPDGRPGKIRAVGNALIGKINASATAMERKIEERAERQVATTAPREEAAKVSPAVMGAAKTANTVAGALHGVSGKVTGVIDGAAQAIGGKLAGNANPDGVLVQTAEALAGVSEAAKTGVTRVVGTYVDKRAEMEGYSKGPEAGQLATETASAAKHAVGTALDVNAAMHPVKGFAKGVAKGAVNQAVQQGQAQQTTGAAQPP